MNGRAAAPPAIECSVGPSTSTNRFAGQRLADRLHDLGAVQEPRQHAFAVDQIEIPQPLPQLGIVQAVILSGGGSSDLVRKCKLVGEDRQLARLACASARHRRRSMSPRSKHWASAQFSSPTCFLPMNS